MKLTLLSEASTRRRFLKQGIGLATAASTGDVSKLAKAGMGFDPLSHLSDEDLMGTPEEEWITKIPGARLISIMRKNPANYGIPEIAGKLQNVLTYGAAHRQAGSILKILLKHAEEAGIPDIGNSILNTMRDYDSLPGEHSYLGGIRKFLDAANEYEIKIPVNKLRKMSHQADGEWQKNMDGYKKQREDAIRDRKQRFEKEKNKPKDIYVPNDYKMASTMHQPYEQRLNRALAII